MNIGTLTVSLVASTTAFEKSMAQAARTMTATAATLKAQGKAMEELGRSMMASFTLPLGLAGGAAVKLAGDMEQTQMAFTQMLGSAQAATQFIRQLQDFAAHTPFEFTQLTDASRRLLAFGFSAESILPMLTAVGDAVSAMGGSADMLDRVITALGQMQAKGRVQSEEMLQLTEAGIPAWRYLADAMGMSTAKVMDLTQRGLIPADRAIQAILHGMESHAPGMMAAQSRTLNGALSNLVDVLKQAGVSIGQAIIQATDLTNRVRSLTDWVQRAANAFAAWPPALRSATVWLGLAAIAAGPLLYGLGMLSRAAGVAGQGAAWLSSMAGRAAFAFAAWRGGAAKLGEALQFLFGSRLKLVLAGITAIVAVGIIVATHWRQLAAVAQAAWDAIGAAALYGASLVVRGVGLILTGISWIIPPLRGAAAAVMGFADQLAGAASASWQAARSAVSAGSAAASQTNALNRAIAGQQGVAKSAQQAAQGQQGLAQATQDAAKTAQDNIQSFDQVHQIQDQMASAASSAPAAPALPGIDTSAVAGGLGGVADLAGAITGPVQDMANGFASAWQHASDAVGQAWANLRNWALQTFPWLGTVVEIANRAIDWVRQNWPTIGPIVQGIASALSVLLIPALIRTAAQAAIAGATLLTNWIAAGLQAAASVAVQVAQIVLLGARWAWLGIQAAAGAAQVVAAWVAQGWQAAASVATQLAQMAVAGARWVWLGVQAAAGAAQVVAAWLAQQAQAAASVAAQVAQLVVLGARWVWMGLTAMASAAQMAAAWLIALGPIPLVIAAVVGLALLIVTHWQQISAFTVQVWTTLTAWLASAWQSISQTAQTIWNGISDFFAKWWPALLVVFTGPLGALVALIVQHWDDITAKTSAAWDKVRSVTEGVRDAVVSAWTWVSDRLGAIWSGIVDTAGRIWGQIVSAVKTPINAVIAAVNGFLDRLASIQVTIPVVDLGPLGTWGGGVIGFPRLPHIPMLATGGNVVGSGLAVVGESGPELVSLPRGAQVTPLSRDNALADSIAQAVYQAVRDALRVSQVGSSPSAGDREIVLRIDGRTFARAVLPAVIAEGQRQGLQLVVRPQGV